MTAAKDFKARIKSLTEKLEAAEKEYWVRGMEIIKLEKLFYAFHSEAYTKAVKEVLDEFDDRCTVKGKKQRELAREKRLKAELGLK